MISGQTATDYKLVGTSKSGNTFTYDKAGATVSTSRAPATRGCNAGKW